MATATAKPPADDLPMAKANPTEPAAAKAPLQTQAVSRVEMDDDPKDEETAQLSTPANSSSAPEPAEAASPTPMPPAAEAGKDAARSESGAAGTAESSLFGGPAERTKDDSTEKTVQDAVALLPPCLVMLLDPKYIVAPPVSSPPSHCLVLYVAGKSNTRCPNPSGW